MREGKPIIEAREYAERREWEKKRRESEHWCSCTSALTLGYACLKSPVGLPHEEPCTKDDFLSCPFKPGTAI